MFWNAPYSSFHLSIDGCFSEFGLETFGEIRVIEKPTIYITSAMVNFFGAVTLPPFSS